MDRLYATQAHTELDASGEAGRTPAGREWAIPKSGISPSAQARVIYQDLMRITKAVESGGLLAR